MAEVRDGYKMTELGEIPTDWNIKKIGEIAEVKTGSTPLRTEKKYWENGNIPWMSSGEVSKKIVESVNEYITKEGYNNSNTTLFPLNTIMMAMNGQGKTRGSVALLKIEATCNQSLAGIIPNELYDSKYLYQYLTSQYEKLRAINGEGRGGLNLSLIKDFKIIIPSLKEQLKIAEILSTVDERIEQTEILIEKTKELKKGLMQQLLTKGIGHTEFKQTELGEIPIDWEIKDIKNIFELISGYAFKSKLFKTEPVQGTLQVVKMGNVKSGNLDLFKNKTFILNADILNSQEKYKLINDDLVISLTGTIGKRDYGNVAIIEKSNQLVLNQRVGCLRKGERKINSKYYYYMLQTELFQSAFFELGVGGTGNQSNVSLNDMGKLRVTCPSMEEQQKIASIISTVDEQIESYEKENAKYGELKKGLMQQLLTGKVRVKID